MRDLSEITAEIEKRSEIRIKKRKTGMAIVVPLVIAAITAVSATALALGKSEAVQPERAVPSKPSEAALIPAPEMPQESEGLSDFSDTATMSRPFDLGVADSREVEEWISGFAVRAKFVRNTGTRMDPDLKAPVTEAEFRVLEICQGDFDGDILVTEYNGGTVSMKDYADVYGKDSVEKLGLGDLTDEELENRTFTDPYELENRFDFEKKDPDTEYLIYVTVNTETGKTWLGDNGLTCLEIKDGMVTSPLTGETMTVSEMLNKY